MNEAVVWRDLNPKVKRGVLGAMNNMSVVDGVAYDTNGNDISTLIDIKPKLTQKQIDWHKEKEAMEKFEEDNGGFVFAFFRQSRMLEERFSSLNSQDMVRLMFIGSYTSWKDGCLKYENGRHIKKGGLHELLKMSRNRFNAFYNRLTDEGIIVANGDGELFMNPSVFYRGSIKEYAYKTDDLQYTRMFRKTVRDLYEAYNGRSLGQLALVYAVMPFVNFKTNIVAFNPEETDEKNVRPMPLEKLAILLGYASVKKLKPALNRVKIDDQPVFGFFENPHDRRSIRTVVNPRAIFGAGAKELSAISALFNL